MGEFPVLCCSEVPWEVCELSGVKDLRCTTESEAACVTGVAARL